MAALPAQLTLLRRICSTDLRNGGPRHRSGVARLFKALALLGSFTFSLTAAAAPSLLGPADPSVLPLGPVPFTPAGSYGVGAGASWTFSTPIALATKTAVYHSALANAVQLSFHGLPYSGVPADTMIYDGSQSNAAAGKVVYTGQTVYPGPIPIFTRVTLTYTQLNGVTPIPLVTAGSVGAPPPIGLLAPIPSAGFIVRYLAEASTDGITYSPAQTLFDAINTANHGPPGGLLNFDLTAGFYWIDVPPTLNTNAGLTISQGATTTVTAAMLQATDVESGPAQVTFTLPLSGGGPPHAGTLTKNSVPLAAGQTFTQQDINNNVIAYSTGFPNGCQISDDFQFSVSDPNGGVIPPPPGPPTVFSFPITINLIHLPPIANNDSFSVGLGAQHTGNLTANNASQCWPPIFTFSLATLPTKGSVVLNDPSTGAYTYTATPGQTGADSFTFNVINVADPSQPSVTPGTISITIANQPPVAQAQTANTNEGVPVSGTLVATDVDLPPQPLTYSIITNGAKGTAVVTNPSTGAFTYTPVAGRMGFDALTWKANDGTLDSNTATLIVNIRPNVTSGRIVTTGTHAGALSVGTQAISTAVVLLVDPVTSDQGVISAGGLLTTSGPIAVALESTGKILALDNGSSTLVRIDPATGSQTSLASGLPNPAIGLAVEPSGSILVALGPNGLSRRDPVTGAQTQLFTTGLNAPIGATVAPNGDIYVGDTGLFVSQPSRIVKVNPVSGAVTPISTGGLISLPIGLALDAAVSTVYVADSPGLFITGPSTLVGVTIATGTQATVATGGNLFNIANLGRAADGTLIVANNGNPATVRVNPADGAQTVLSSGGELGGTFGIAIISQPPAFQSAVSRRLHGAAGTFDLALSLVPTNPTTEPRQGPAQNIVFTFDKPILSANAGVTEGVATAGAPTFSGNDVVVPLTGVANQQYVTVALTNVVAADGGSGGSGSVRVGFLLGDVNQTRVVSVADLGLVNVQLSQPVTVANFLKDVNVSGAISVADKGLTNSKLTTALPAP